jgi:hypothetical protein
MVGDSQQCHRGSIDCFRVFSGALVARFPKKMPRKRCHEKDATKKMPRKRCHEKDAKKDATKKMPRKRCHEKDATKKMPGIQCKFTPHFHS